MARFRPPNGNSWTCHASHTGAQAYHNPGAGAAYLEIFSIARRKHDGRAASVETPQRIQVRLCPAGVRHDNISKPARGAVQHRETSIVSAHHTAMLILTWPEVWRETKNLGKKRWVHSVQSLSGHPPAAHVQQLQRGRKPAARDGSVIVVCRPALVNRVQHVLRHTTWNSSVQPSRHKPKTSDMRQQHTDVIVG